MRDRHRHRHRERVAAEVDEEIAFHLALSAAELARDGMPEHDAIATAHARFGDVGAARRASLHERLWSDIMIQRAHLALTTLLLVALAVLVAQRSAASATRTRDMRALERRIDSLIAAVQPTVEHDDAAPLRTDHGRLAVGDRIRLVDLTKVHRDVERTVTVQRDGMVLLPELGWVDAAGVEREELAATFGALYDRILVDPPKIAIEFIEQASHRAPVLDAIVAREGDRLIVRDEAHPDEIDLATTVDRTGKVVLPDLGVVHVAGLTRAEIESMLAERYFAYYTDAPVIRVLVESD